MIIVSNTSASFAYDLSAGWFNTCAIAAGVSHTCVIDDYDVNCWGSSVAVGVPDDLTNATTIAASGVTCWGYGNHGQSTIPEGLVFIPEPSRDALAVAAMSVLMLLTWKRRRGSR